MAGTAQQIEPTDGQQPVEQATLLVCIPSGRPEEAQAFQKTLSALFPHGTVIAAHGEEMLQNTSAAGGDEHWTLTAAAYAAAARLAMERNATATLLLGAEAHSLSETALKDLVTPVLAGETDLSVPRFELGPNEALVSSALLYPFTKALFGANVHLPLPTDAVLSLRFAARISQATARPATGQSGTFFWPASEAAISSVRTLEVAAGHRTLPLPPNRDLKSLLAEVATSLFSDLETKASFWQRGRVVSPADQIPLAGQPEAAAAVHETAPEIPSMVEAFRSAYDDLQEIWSLVLPPQSLFRIQRLSRTSTNEFAFPPDLWARTAYDFLLAFHQRTINRGHLLGAMTPLYLGWVASHIRQSAGDGAAAAQHVEECAAAFVAEKPYLVSRWRWPDRFNP
jgi:hypothetical protein